MLDRGNPREVGSGRKKRGKGKRGHGDDDDDDNEAHGRRAKGKHHKPTPEKLARAVPKPREKPERASDSTNDEAEPTSKELKKLAEKINGELAKVNEPLLHVAMIDWQKKIGPNPVSNEKPINPVMADAQITSPFGLRNLKNPSASHNHNGADFWVPNGYQENTGIAAAVSGTVLFTGEWKVEGGQTIIIGGDDGRLYSYSHLKEGSFSDLKIGQHVRQGEQIAIMGNTGNSNQKVFEARVRGLPKPETDKDKGYCLHFVVRIPPNLIKLTAQARDSAIKSGATDLDDATKRVLIDQYKAADEFEALAKAKTDIKAYTAISPVVDGKETRAGATFKRHPLTLIPANIRPASMGVTPQETSRAEMLSPPDFLGLVRPPIGKATPAIRQA